MYRYSCLFLKLLSLNMSHCDWLISDLDRSSILSSCSIGDCCKDGITFDQAWLILQAHRARALGPRPLGGPQKRETMVGRERERERGGEKEKRKKESK